MTKTHNIDVPNHNLETAVDLVGKEWYIPKYQRPYEWTDLEVQTFWDDLQPRITSESKKRKAHFFGSIYYTYPEQTYYQIEDGQQRVVTVNLLKYAADALKRDIAKLLQQDCLNEKKCKSILHLLCESVANFTHHKALESLYTKALQALDEAKGSDPENVTDWEPHIVDAWNSIKPNEKKQSPSAEDLTKEIRKSLNEIELVIQKTEETIRLSLASLKPLAPFFSFQEFFEPLTASEIPKELLSDINVMSSAPWAWEDHGEKIFWERPSIENTDDGETKIDFGEWSVASPLSGPKISHEYSEVKSIFTDAIGAFDGRLMWTETIEKLLLSQQLTNLVKDPELSLQNEKKWVKFVQERVKDLIESPKVRQSPLMAKRIDVALTILYWNIFRFVFNSVDEDEENPLKQFADNFKSIALFDSSNLCLIEKALRDFRLVSVMITDATQAQSYFRNINSRGRSLTFADQVKNMILLADKSEKIKCYELMIKKINAIYQGKWGFRSVVMEELIVTTGARILLEKKGDVSDPKLLVEIEKKLNSPDCSNFLEEFDALIERLIKGVERLENLTNDPALRSLKALDLDTIVFPWLIFLSEIQEEKRPVSANQLSYVLWTIFRFENKPKGFKKKEIYSLLHSLFKATGESTANTETHLESFKIALKGLNHLRNEKGVLRKKMDRDSLKKFLDEPMYPRGGFWILYSYELTLYDENPRVVSNSIEHIFPQKPKDKKKWEPRELNGIGNLVLLWRSQNQKLGNKMFPEKQLLWKGLRDKQPVSRQSVELFEDNKWEVKRVFTASKAKTRKNHITDELLASFVSVEEELQRL